MASDDVAYALTRSNGTQTTLATGPRTTSEAEWAVELTEILVDAGPLIAGFDDTDVWHDECSRLLESLPGPLIVRYMITRYRFGSTAEAAFLRSFAEGDVIVGNLVQEDFERMAQLVEQYDSFPLGGSDASVIAIAERRSITTILTTDRRHFAAVRPTHVEAFDLLP